MSSNSHLTSLPSNEHVMLLYSNDAERNNATASYINNGLKWTSVNLFVYHCI